LRIQSSDETETSCFTFSEPLTSGTGVLSIEFAGILNDKLKGFYRSKYTGADGQEERYAAVTHFEPTGARRAFPGWDEPAIRATFAITLEVPVDRTTLSNTDVLSEEVLVEDLSVKRVKYSTTPLMSTYLLAFIVGEFDFVESATNDGVRVRVYAPVGKASQGEFALEVGVKAIDYYNDYFGIPYPLPKLDMIAIADFAIGAMENWGLVTYRETALLVDPLNTSAVRKQYIALVVAHELSHQWFGNLVTIEWWTR